MEGQISDVRQAVVIARTRHWRQFSHFASVSLDQAIFEGRGERLVGRLVAEAPDDREIDP